MLAVCTAAIATPLTISFPVLLHLPLFPSHPLLIPALHQYIEMSNYTAMLPTLTPISQSKSTSLYLLPDSRYLRVTEFPSESALMTQMAREDFSKQQTGLSIVETLEIIKDPENKLRLYVVTPYYPTLENDYRERQRNGRLYDEQTLWGYLREVVEGLAHLQQKVVTK